MSNKMLWLFVSTLIVVVIYIFAAPYIYAILFPAYIGSVIYSQVYAVSLLGTTLSPASSYINAKRKIKEQYLSTTINSVLQIVTIFVGIIFWGLWGLIFARVIIRLGGQVVTYGLYLNAVQHEDA